MTYHGENGEELYTVTVKAGDRSFVQEVTLPETGATVTTPIDADAFTAVEENIQNNEVFREWQWVQTDGSTQRWEWFCNNKITQDMDLYPVTISVKVQDKDNTMETIYREEGDQTQIDSSKLEVKVRMGTAEANSGYLSAVSVLLMSEYSKDKLYVTAQELAYTPGVAPVEAAIAEVPVNLTLRHNNDINQSDAEASSLYGSTKTADDGTATFVLLGDLTVAKQMGQETEGADGQMFPVTVNWGTWRRTFMLTAGDSRTLEKAIPFGQNWTVAEDESWAWRYQAQYSKESGTLTSYTIRDTVTVTNTLDNSRWFDGNDSKHNVFYDVATP